MGVTTRPRLLGTQADKEALHNALLLLYCKSYWGPVPSVPSGGYAHGQAPSIFFKIGTHNIYAIRTNLAEVTPPDIDV